MSDYDDLMASALEITRSEVKIVLDLFPNNSKPMPDFNYDNQNESWNASMRIPIEAFKNSVKNFQNTLVIYV